VIPLSWVLVSAALLFGLGLYGALARTNAVRILIAIELMLNAVNLNLVGFSRYLSPHDVTGQVFALFVITVAAAEAAVGLAIILMIVRQRDVSDVDRINLLKW